MKHVLIVDDDPVARQLVRAVMQNYDVDITDAESGAEALANMMWRDYDLIVTDLIMRGIDGWAVIQQARKTKCGSKVVAMSGGLGGQLPASRALAAASKLGADSIIAKPLDPVALEIELHDLLAD